MFRTKSKAEERRQQTASLVDSAGSAADQLRGRVIPVVGHVAVSAKDWSQPHMEAARHWAMPHVMHGKEIAAPRLESAVTSLAPKVDTARDKIVDDLLPRLAEAISAFLAVSAAAKDEAVSRGAGAAAVITGEAVAAPKRKKKGNKLKVMFWALGIFAAAAGVVVAFMKKSAHESDPWATPMSDSYVAPAVGRHSGNAFSGSDPLSEPGEPEIAESLDGLDELDEPDMLDAAPDAFLTDNGSNEPPRP